MGPADWINVGLTSAQLVLQSVFGVHQWIMMENMWEVDWLIEKARGISFEFDTTLLTHASKIYDYYKQILTGEIFTKEVVTDIMSRLYVFIGILILFRLATVFIKYVVSPEAFNDTKQGAGNLVKRVVLGCVIIAVIPVGFSFARRIQVAVIDDRIIEKTLLPADAYKELAEEDLGNRITMMVFRGFFRWNPRVSKNKHLDVYNEYEKLLVYDNVDISSFDADNVTEKEDGEYLIEYFPILSTLSIGFVLYTFVKYALELALRSIKLAFLQIIAPFIVVDYMLKPGDDETLKKYMNITISTYLIIFMRVLTVWIIGLLSFYLEKGVPGNTDAAGNYITSLVQANSDMFMKAMIVLAAFAFLKDFPKLMSELTGYNFQENEAIEGLMQKGVGVIKGFAMGKAMHGIAKEQYLKTAGFQVAGTALGAGSNMSSTIGTAKKPGAGGASGGGVGGSASGGGMTNKQTIGLAGVNFMGDMSKGMGSAVGGISQLMGAASPFQGMGQAMATSAYSPYTMPTAHVTPRSMGQGEQELAHEEKAKSAIVNNMVHTDNGFYDKANKTFDMSKTVNQGGTSISFEQSLANQINNSGISYNGEQIKVTNKDISSALATYDRDVRHKEGTDVKNGVYNSELTKKDVESILDSVVTTKKGAIDQSNGVKANGSSSGGAKV